MRVENKPIFPFFLSGCRIVEKKRYDKLNDAAYSALKYRVCAANFFINSCYIRSRLNTCLRICVERSENILIARVAFFHSCNCQNDGIGFQRCRIKKLVFFLIEIDFKFLIHD